jgi:uncharacterized protein (TIGR00369 family)
MNQKKRSAIGMPFTKPSRNRPLTHTALQGCFGCGERNRSGLRLRFYVDGSEQVVCSVRLAQRFEGPPGHAHGGIVAALLDEAMSKANRARSIVAMTRHIEVNYLRPVPLKSKLQLTARHLSADGRKHRCEAEIRDADGELLAAGKALFIAVDAAYLPRTPRGT